MRLGACGNYLTYLSNLSLDDGVDVVAENDVSGRVSWVQVSADYCDDAAELAADVV